MQGSPLFICEHSWHAKRIRALLAGIPTVAGKAIRVETAPGLRDRSGPVHAGTFVRERRMAFDCTRNEFPRIFVHELFHFVWLRLGNPSRHSFEDMVGREWRRGARGELGWSSEWRKRELTMGDVRGRNRRWREYCCESFCDTAAWMYSGVETHQEYLLAPLFRQRRGTWFRKTIAPARLSI